MGESVKKGCWSIWSSDKREAGSVVRMERMNMRA